MQDGTQGVRLREDNIFILGALVIMKEWNDGLWIIFGLVDQNSEVAIIFCSLRLIEVFNLKTCPHKGRYKVPLCPMVLLQQHTGECFWEWWLSVKIAKIGVERRNGQYCTGGAAVHSWGAAVSLKAQHGPVCQAFISSAILASHSPISRGRLVPKEPFRWKVIFIKPPNQNFRPFCGVGRGEDKRLTKPFGRVKPKTEATEYHF